MLQFHSKSFSVHFEQYIIQTESDFPLSAYSVHQIANASKYKRLDKHFIDFEWMIRIVCWSCGCIMKEQINAKYGLKSRSVTTILSHPLKEFRTFEYFLAWIMELFVTFQFLIGFFTTFVVSHRHSNVYDVRFACEVKKGIYFYDFLLHSEQKLNKNSFF